MTWRGAMTGRGGEDEQHLERAYFEIYLNLLFLFLPALPDVFFLVVENNAYLNLKYPLGVE